MAISDDLVAPPHDRALVLGLAACAGGLACRAPLEAAAATALVLLAFARRGRPVLALLGALAFLVGAARSSSSLRAYERERARVVEAGPWPARCAIEGAIARSPVLVGDAFRVDVAVSSADCARRRSLRPRGLVTLHVPREIALELARGDDVGAVVELAPGHRFHNDDAGDPRPAQARRGVLLSGGAQDVVVRRRARGVLAVIDRARSRLRARILATYPAETAAMARALVLGEDDLTVDDQRAFRQSGLAHLLAVSGMHLVLVVASFVAGARAIFVRIAAIVTRIAPIRLAAALGLPLAWIYADLAGGSGSAIRAAWMTSAALLAHALSRRPDTARAFGLSIAAMVLADPLVAFDLSFALSGAATAGLLGLAPPIARRALALAPAWLGPSWHAPVVRATAASISASLACAPILACMTPDLPVAGAVANLVAVPLGEMAALPLCLVHTLLGALPTAERGCALAASGALGLVRAVAHGFARIPWGSAPVPVPTPGQLAVVAVCILAWPRAAIARGRLQLANPRRAWRWGLLCAVALASLEIGARARGSPRGVLRVTFLDVGQGDAAIVDLPDGTAMLLDAGGLVGSPVDTGERVVAPVLRARRRSSFAAAVLSHPHPDHFGGMRLALAAVSVGALWDTGQGEADGAGPALAALLAELRARGVPILRPADLCGTHALGGARVEVLAPCPDRLVDRGANDNSLVIRISLGARSFLFVGDAERAEEADLIASRPGALRADVLKVGHHGSRTSSSARFLEAVDPEIAVVSCGIRNRFGHPALDTLATLARTRARLFRTDRDGSVMITTDGRTLSVRAAAE